MYVSQILDAVDPLPTFWSSAGTPTILPHRQFADSLSSPFRKNILLLKIRNNASLRTQITCIYLAIPHPSEGRFAIVTDVGRGMRWTRRVTRRMTLRGRRSRVVLTPRRWRQVLEKQASRG